MTRALVVLVLVVLLLPGSLKAQEAHVRAASKVSMPTPVDSNSPAIWRDGTLRWFGSHGRPQVSEGRDQFGPWVTREVGVDSPDPWPRWLESVWQEGNGVIWGWYHTEPTGLVEGSTLTAPKIGAVASFDGGSTLRDLGVVLESGDPIDPNSQNGYFAGGHGDFSVILDRQRKYFYFLFDNYGGPVGTQGVVVARMAFEDRFNPVGKVWKYHNGAWQEPGKGGRATPIIPVRRGWQLKDPDAFWGPSVHFNTYLNCYVMLLNRAQGEPGWSQEGVYVSYSSTLSRPETWTEPVRILDKSQFSGWYFFYPQVMGLEAGGTDTLAGATARLYVGGVSKWEIDFRPKPAAPFDPALEVSPATGAVKAGATVVLSVLNSGTPPFTYQWFKDGVAVPGATAETLALRAVAPAHAGTYAVVIANPQGAVTSGGVTVSVEAPVPLPPPPPVAYLTNLSVRSALAAGQEVLTLGYVTRSPAEKTLLIRAIGPSLAQFGLTGGMADPRLAIFDARSVVTAENDDWNPVDAPAVAATGAFALPVGSADASLWVNVPAGAGTAQVRGDAPGVVMIEIYDPGAARGAKLVNASVRAQVGVGGEALIGGFALGGAGSQRLLIRAAGPMLAQFGVSRPVPDPQVEIFDDQGVRLADNDDWDAALAATFEQVGAAPFAPGSRDAAVLLTFAAGQSYTVIVRGQGGAAGEALLELFEVP